jgi:hypothetical protein
MFVICTASSVWRFDFLILFLVAFFDSQLYARGARPESGQGLSSIALSQLGIECDVNPVPLASSSDSVRTQRVSMFASLTTIKRAQISSTSLASHDDGPCAAASEDSPFHFQLTSFNVSFFVMCSSAETRNEWVHAIRDAIEARKISDGSFSCVNLTICFSWTAACVCI